MSANIDKNIVQMEMDNTQFEKGAKDTIATLDKLKESLNFSQHGDSFKELSDSMNNTKFSGLSSSLSSIGENFSALEATALGVFIRIGEKAADLGMNLIKSLTIEPFKESWGKYDQAIASQQSIMSAVEGKVDKNGNAYDMDAVVERVDKLKWFADETSYSIDQMTNALGQFTASGQDLDMSVDAVMGIANACADAGVSTQKAESAFIGFSKAIGAGQLTLGTWNMQLKTSGITNSERFRKTLLETAAAMGTLKEKTEGVYELNGEEVNTANFTEYLNKGIITSDVLIASLNKFSDTTLKVREIANGNIEAIADVYKTAGVQMTDSMSKKLEDIAENGTTAHDAIESLKQAYIDVGAEIPKSLSALGRAQEAISFTQAIDAAKEAVTSQFSNIYEAVFGNYEEAKQLWSSFADDLNGWVVTPLYDLVDVFWEVKDMWNNEEMDYGNSVTQAMGVYRAFSAVITEIIDLLSELWNEATDLYGPTAEDIFNFIEGIRNGLWDIYGYIAQAWEATSIKGIKSGLEGIFSFINLIVRGLQKIKDNFISPLISKFKPILDDIAYIFGNIGDKIYYMSWDIMKADFPGLTSILNLLLDVLNPIINAISKITGWIKEITAYTPEIDEETGLLVERGSVIADIIDSVRKAFEKLKEKISPAIDTIADGFDKIFGKLKDINILEKIGDGLVWIFDHLGQIFSDIIPLVGELATGLGIGNLALSVSSLVKSFGSKGLLGLFGNLDGLVESFSGTISAVGDSLRNLFGKKEDDLGKKLITIAAGLLVLAISLKLIASIDPERIASSLVMLGSALGIIIGYLKLMGGVLESNTTEKGGIIGKIFGKTKTTTLSDSGKGLIKLGAGILVLALALKVFASIDPGRLIVSLGALMVVLLELAAFASLTKNLSLKGSSGIVGLAAGLLIITGALAVLANIEPAGLVNALGALTLILVELGLFAEVMKKIDNGSLLASSASVLIMANSILLIAGALALLSVLNQEKLFTTVLMLGVVLGEFAIALGALSMISGKSNGIDMIAVAGAMLILALAIDVLTPALIALSLVKFTSLIKALGAIALALIIFGAAAAILTPVIPSLLGLGAAILIIGAGIGVAAAGIAALAVALITLSTAGSSAISFINVFVTMMIGFIPMIIEAIGKGIIRVLKMLTELGSTLKDLIVTYVAAVCDALIESVPKILETVGVLLTSFLQFIAEYLPAIIDTGILIISELCRGLVEAIPIVVKAIGEVIIAIIEGIADLLPDIIQAGFDLIIAFLDGIADGIENNTGTLVDSLIGLGGAMVDGLIDGLVAGVKGIGNAIWSLGEKAINGLKDVLGINSPSKEFRKIGKFADQGLANGIKDYSYFAEDASEDLGKKSTNALSDALSKVGENIDDDMNLNPTITPILDLSEIDGNQGLISKLLNGEITPQALLNPLFQNGEKLAGTNGITLNLTNNFDVKSGQTIDRATVRSWSQWIADDINEELGRRTK